MKTLVPHYDEYSVLADLDGNVGRRYPVEAYGEWLGGRAPWQLFVTLTVKDATDDLGVRVGRTTALAGFTHVGVAGSERFLRKWFRDSVRSRSEGRAYGAFALEKHRDRVTPHFHGLVGGMPPWLLQDTALGLALHDRSRSYLHREWYRDHGMARMEPIAGVLGDAHRATGCARYASKYMLKDGGKFYALGAWPQVSEYDEGMAPGTSDDVEARWQSIPGAGNAERVWREICDGTWQGDW